MFAFLAPLLSGFTLFYRIGASLLAGLGLGRVLDWFDFTGGSEDKEAARSMVGLIGVLFVALVAVFWMGKKGVLNGKRRY